MFVIVQRLWATITSFAERVSQKVLGWFGKDRRSVKAAAERQVVVKAKVELATIRNTTYATSTQADIALHGYRHLYQQITLPEVRRELLAPAGLNIVLVGGAWRIMDQAAARCIKAIHNVRKVGRQKKRRADAGLACAAR